MASSFGTEEFTIDASRFTLLERYTKKVERLFGVKVAVDETLDGENKIQWLVVSGVKENRCHASMFVQAMCNPEQVFLLEVGGRSSVDDAVLEEVEQKSAVFIQRTGSLTMEVMGLELQCALAISQLEQTYQLVSVVLKEAAHETCPEAVCSLPGSSCNNRWATESNPSSVAASEVDSVRDMAMDTTDNSLKRPQQENSSHLDDTDMFGPGHGGLQSTLLALSTLSSYVHTTSPLSGDQAAQKSTRSLSHHRGKQQKTECVTAVSEALGEVVSPSSVGGSGSSAMVQQTNRTGLGSKGKIDTTVGDPQMAGDVEVEQKLKLKKMGQSMGYNEQDVSQTLQFFDCSLEVQPTEFLTALDSVRKNRLKDSDRSDLLESETDLPPGPLSATHKDKSKKKSGRKSSSAAAMTHQNVAKPSAGALMSPNHPATKAVIVSPGKNPSINSSARGSENPVEKVLDDSVVFVSAETNDDSICVIHPASFLPSSKKRDLPQSPCTKLSMPEHKRKEYSRNEDETTVLKPYRAGPSWADSSGTGSSRQDWRPELTQVAEGAVTCSEAATTTRDNNLRYIVIDGCNVAMAHGNNKEFSCRGIRICVDHFLQRGHRVKALVPLTKTYQNQGGRNPPIRNQEILEELKEEGLLVFSPARTFNRKHVVSHDDPLILELARKEDAVVVSNDNFREFVGEYSFIIENRVLSFLFSDDHFMLPRDPLGRSGPSLEEFLRKTPYQTQTQSVADSRSRALPVNKLDQAMGHDQYQLCFQPARGPDIRGGAVFPTVVGFQGMQLGRLVSTDSPEERDRQEISSVPVRHHKVTEQLLEALKTVFPEEDQEPKIRQVLENHNTETDLNKLTNYCIAALNL